MKKHKCEACDDGLLADETKCPECDGTGMLSEGYSDDDYSEDSGYSSDYINYVNSFL